jgi:predicted nuclease of predicted toxin-antitoxin system
MRFLVDECTGPKVAKWLKERGYEVFSVYDKARGSGDETVLRIANKDNYILITNDNDFGELIFRMKKPHKGIILLRVEDNRPNYKIEVLDKLLQSYSDQLKNNFIVATENKVRIIKS